jgi:uncharacterized protein YeaC (DUF1315 family)
MTTLTITNVTFNWTTTATDKVVVGLGSIELFGCLTISFALKYNAQRKAYWMSLGNSKKDAKSGKWFDGCRITYKQRELVLAAVTDAYKAKVAQSPIDNVIEQGKKGLEKFDAIVETKAEIAKINVKIKEKEAKGECSDHLMEEEFDAKCALADFESELKF